MCLSLGPARCAPAWLPTATFRPCLGKRPQTEQLGAGDMEVPCCRQPRPLPPPSPCSDLVHTSMCVHMYVCVYVLKVPSLGGPRVCNQEPHLGWVSRPVSDAPEQPLSLMGTRRPDEQTQGQQWVSLGSAWAWQVPPRSPACSPVSSGLCPVSGGRGLGPGPMRVHGTSGQGPYRTLGDPSGWTPLAAVGAH